MRKEKGPCALLDAQTTLNEPISKINNNTYTRLDEIRKLGTTMYSEKKTTFTRERRMGSQSGRTWRIENRADIRAVKHEWDNGHVPVVQKKKKRKKNECVSQNGEGAGYSCTHPEEANCAFRKITT